MASASPTEDPTSARTTDTGSNRTRSLLERTELETLRQQVSELTEQVQRHLSNSAGGALNRATDAAGEVMSGVSARGREAVAGVQEVKDNFAGAIDASLKNRPYTTLVVAFGIGFLLGRLR